MDDLSEFMLSDWSLKTPYLKKSFECQITFTIIENIVLPFLLPGENDVDNIYKELEV